MNNAADSFLFFNFKSDPLCFKKAKVTAKNSVIDSGAEDFIIAR